ncbi:MAG: DNA polymerase III subunit delta [Tatlockia sp.]|nr:DNA polymerase III subunit delta [Tatlockia sp.]
MLIKLQALASHLRQKLAAIYILFGQDFYLLNEAAESLKKAWKLADPGELEESILSIASPSDWDVVNEEANSYSLFANRVLLDLRYEKKTLEAAGKDFLNRYLKNPNPSCLLILRAPNLSLKLLQAFSHQENLNLIQASPLSGAAMQQWIAAKLQAKDLKFERDIPALIHQFTEGNMLACAQVIEKLELVADAETLLSHKLVSEQLIDQCEFQLFELADACLAANSEKVVQLLRHAYHSKAEPTLILWILAQEIRLLLQLKELTGYQALAFNTACSQLKIWPQRTKLYQIILAKIKTSTLLDLLGFCKLIDERIKTTQNNQIWQSLEQIALSLSLTKQVGSFA